MAAQWFASNIGHARWTCLVEVDFGFQAGGGEDTTATATVINAPWITSLSNIYCRMAMISTADHDPEDAVIEALHPYVLNIVPGSGFDVIVSAPNGTWGRYIVECVVI